MTFLTLTLTVICPLFHLPCLRPVPAQVPVPSPNKMAQAPSMKSFLTGDENKTQGQGTGQGGGQGGGPSADLIGKCSLHNYIFKYYISIFCIYLIVVQHV